MRVSNKGHEVSRIFSLISRCNARKLGFKASIPQLFWKWLEFDVCVSNCAAEQGLKFS